ncbi:hypothetical protein EVAR_83377_1 [Eumeta japonica]|uniref:Uncharacterized protein n=1 Tax=Eumeta variegata TaxID=151549 RepID=A0A4C1TYD9_EUMVA|nr:hypothetical protein EVAR_83377_1 [Eumeta japonica]
MTNTPHLKTTSSQRGDNVRNSDPDQAVCFGDRIKPSAPDAISALVTTVIKCVHSALEAVWRALGSSPAMTNKKIVGVYLSIMG